MTTTTTRPLYFVTDANSGERINGFEDSRHAEALARELNATYGDESYLVTQCRADDEQDAFYGLGED